MKRVHKPNERGIAHVLIILLVVVVLAAVGYVGWKVIGKKSTTTAIKSSTTPATTSDTTAASAAQKACLAAFHDTDLCKFVAAETATPLAKTQYKMTITGTSSGVASNITELQDGKSNTAVTIISGGSSISTISLDGQSYTQASAGSPWITYGAGSSSSSQPSPDATLTTALNNLTAASYTKLGKEACGSLTCFKYQIQSKATPNATQYIWFDTKDYLMRQYYETGVAGGDTFTMVINYQSVTINKPSPVQNASQSGGP